MKIASVTFMYGTESVLYPAPSWGNSDDETFPQGSVRSPGGKLLVTTRAGSWRVLQLQWPFLTNDQRRKLKRFFGASLVNRMEKPFTLRVSPPSWDEPLICGVTLLSTGAVPICGEATPYVCDEYYEPSGACDYTARLGQADLAWTEVNDGRHALTLTLDVLN